MFLPAEEKAALKAAKSKKSKNKNKKNRNNSNEGQIEFPDSNTQIGALNDINSFATQNTYTPDPRANQF